jgi:type II secretory pathway component GspD/PulD (secretin)
MKISNCVVGGVLVLSGLCPTRAVWAQSAELTIVPTTPPAPAGTTEKKTYELRLRNIKPSLMAFWLDPQNNERPAELGPALTSEGRFGIPAPKNNAFALPEGVDRIVAVDPQNALLVFGTPEGVAKLRETVGFLDKPLRQIEIEAQFVSVKAEDVAAFGIDFSTARGNNTNAATLTPATGGKPGVQLGFVRGNFQAALSKLQTDNGAKVISAPRVTAINNLTASIESMLSQPMVVGTQDKQGNFQPFYGQTSEGQLTPPLEAGTSLHLEMTPTINNDNTITVRLRIDKRLQLQAGGPTPAPTTLQILNGLDIIANVRDGETIAVGGFDPASPPKGQRIPILGDIPL